jgi:hypothetical protein
MLLSLPDCNGDIGLFSERAAKASIWSSIDDAWNRGGNPILLKTRFSARSTSEYRTHVPVEILGDKEIFNLWSL